MRHPIRKVPEGSWVPEFCLWMERSFTSFRISPAGSDARKRLNLLKKILASTLRAFHRPDKLAPWINWAGRVHG
jgi:hypothetical protein